MTSCENCGRQANPKPGKPCPHCGAEPRKFAKDPDMKGKSQKDGDQPQAVTMGLNEVSELDTLPPLDDQPRGTMLGMGPLGKVLPTESEPASEATESEQESDQDSEKIESNPEKVATQETVVVKDALVTSVDVDLEDVEPHEDSSPRVPPPRPGTSHASQERDWSIILFWVVALAAATTAICLYLVG